MNRVDAFAGLLKTLIEQGSIPSSSLRGKNRDTLKPLFTSGILDEISRGSGSVVIVASREHFDKYIKQEYPSGLDFETNDCLPRASGVQSARNSKKTSQRDCEPVLLRGFNEAVLQSPTGILPVADLTKSHGIASFLNDGQKGFSYSGKIATVENLEFFTHFERIKSDEMLVIYTGGRISRLLLSWLSSQEMSDCSIVHYGDYDPVGLDEYLRIKEQCPGRTSLFIPENLEVLFKKYGNTELIRKSTSVLGRLRVSNDHDVRLVISLVHKYNCGLEQEILLTTF
ncbi:MAG: hypothetical protein KAR40_12070 [Candidatus Sabulitectum sp.]|nr:hypothetical protein [Candidatus Sabulitectum sp.]